MVNRAARLICLIIVITVMESIDRTVLERETLQPMNAMIGPPTKLFANPIFLSAFFSLVGAQLIKALISLAKARKEEDFREAMIIFFWRTGGMPSSHSATALSICTATLLTEGYSNLFILSLFFTLIVIRDALGVRRSSGLQSQALNKLGATLEEKAILDYDPVKEVRGHTLAEVLVGAALGVGIAIIFSA